MVKLRTILTIIWLIFVLIIKPAYLSTISEMSAESLKTDNEAIEKFVRIEMKKYKKWLSFWDPYGPILKTVFYQVYGMDLKIGNQSMEGQSKASKIDIDVHSDINSNSIQFNIISHYEENATLQGDYQVNAKGFKFRGIDDHGSYMDVPFHGKGKFAFDLNKTMETINVYNYTINEKNQIEISDATVDYRIAILDGETKLEGIELGKYDKLKYQNSTVLTEHIDHMLVQVFQKILGGDMDKSLFSPTKKLLLDFLQNKFKKFKIPNVIPKKKNKKKVNFTTKSPVTYPTQRTFKSKTSFSESKEGQSFLKPYFKVGLDSNQKSTRQKDTALENFLFAIMENYTIWLSLHEPRNLSTDTFEYHFDQNNNSLQVTISNQTIAGHSKTPSEIIGAFSDINSCFSEVTLSSYYGSFATFQGKYTVNLSTKAEEFHESEYNEKFWGEGKFILKIKSSKQKLLLSGYKITDDGYIDISSANVEHEYFISEGENELHWTNIDQYENKNTALNLGKIEKSIVHVIHRFLAGLDIKNSVSLPKAMMQDYLMGRLKEHKLSDILDFWKPQALVFSSSRPSLHDKGYELVVLVGTLLATNLINFQKT